MRSSHQRHVRTLGPRALAILSCALALLAAQPVMAGGGRETVVALRQSGGEAALARQSTVVRTSAVLAPSVVPVAATVNASRRRHVLATVEILKRLLAFELRAVERPAFLGILPLTPPQLCLFEVPLAAPYRIGALDPPVLPVERGFAMARCLLAPPLA